MCIFDKLRFHQKHFSSLFTINFSLFLLFFIYIFLFNFQHKINKYKAVNDLYIKELVTIMQQFWIIIR